jgi:Fe-S-cluster-containing hydrogenase component 2
VHFVFFVVKRLLIVPCFLCLPWFDFAFGGLAMPEATGSLHIALDESLCTGCLSCMLVCSERHTGTSNLQRARIHIELDPLTAEHSGRTCHQCADAACAAICPQEAISYDEALRAWRVSDDDCIGCGQCVDACPYGIMRLDPVTDVACKCDLCLGKTYCVGVCPPGALRVVGLPAGGGEEAGDVSSACGMVDAPASLPLQNASAEDKHGR